MAHRAAGFGVAGSAATTAGFVMGTLFGILASGTAVVASQPWESEPAPSVMVESGTPSGSLGFADGGLGSDGGTTVADDAFAAGDSFATVGDGSCTHCDGAGCTECGPPTIFDVCGGLCHDKQACWIGRADALLLWRNSPPGGVIVDNALLPGGALTAGGMESAPAAGPRFSIFRVNNCTGHAIEATYLRASNFRSLRPLDPLASPYQVAAPGIYGNTGLPFDAGNADLGARLQSFELNRHHCVTRCVRFLAGFRWIQWQEQFSMQTYAAGAPADFFQTSCWNDLYGGQIGLDANLLATRWIRFDSVVKAGAYYNTAVQTSQYVTTRAPASMSDVSVGDSPLSGAFAGEVGLTGVIPLASFIDLRVGYFGLWLSGIAQPTQQLAGQLLPGPPALGSINANGGVFVQGASLGLEGRW